MCFAGVDAIGKVICSDFIGIEPKRPQAGDEHLFTTGMVIGTGTFLFGTFVLLLGTLVVALGQLGEFDGGRVRLPPSRRLFAAVG